MPDTERHILIVLSDFLEDDGQYRFSTDRRLSNCESSRQFARRLLEAHGFVLRGLSLFLGGLDSSDSGTLGPQRRNAIRTFWSSYFGEMGAHQEIQVDGTGMLAQFGG